MNQKSLTPVLIAKGTKPYLSVEKLRECLKDNDIYNIALTGPFGSGKSSVVKTLISEEEGHYNFLEISLATLDSEKEEKKEESVTINEKIDKSEETLSKRIEMGILQQLVYREKDSTLPFSRFRRIHSFEKDEVTRLVIESLLAIICIAIAFEPKFLMIDTLCRMFNFGDTNVIFDFLAMGYLIWFSWVFLHWIIKKYWGSKFSKLNLTDGEIEVKESGSIFNEHLEEILYFFQSTDYNVVVLEDLDRFNNSMVFLKLRELNYLLRQSKALDRKIVFVYSIRDDLFSDASRTKFFDYIIPVIPIMNVSNAEGLLMEELNVRGYTDIKDEDMGDIAGFIDDMRLLHNIANEYQQYREQLMVGTAKLDSTKLLASIVYKNYYPDEYALMHREQGRIARCFEKKNVFIDYAKKERIEKGLELAQKDMDAKKASVHLSLSELRLLYIYEYIQEINAPQLNAFIIDGYSYIPKDVAADDSVFDKLRSNNTVVYSRHDTGRNYNATVEFAKVEKKVSEIPYEKRKEMIADTDGSTEAALETYKVQAEIVANYTLQQLMMQFNISSTEEFKALGLEPMEELFLKRGYIAEDYLDYLSYFYPGMITENDRQLLLEMKLDRKPAYDRRIDKIDNFMSKLPDYVYNTDSILNLKVVDWIAKDTNRRKLTLVVKRIKDNSCHLKFLVALNREKSSACSVVNQMYMHRFADKAWNNITKCDNKEDVDLLRQIWLQWALVADVKETQREWLNKNYAFLSSHIHEISVEKATQLLLKSKIEKLDNESPELLDNVVKAQAYVINPSNLAVINEHYTGKKTLVGSVNYEMIGKIEEPEFQDYVSANINDVVKSLAIMPSEPYECQVEIINNQDVDENIWIDYIGKQTNLIPNAEDIVVQNRLQTLYAMGHIAPNWNNVYYYYSQFKADNILATFVNSKAEGLEKAPMTLNHNEKWTLYRQFVLTNLMSLDTFKKLFGKFGYKVLDGDIELLEQIANDRLSFLVAHGKIDYSVKMRTWMSNRVEYADFMLKNKKHLLADCYDVTYTTDLAVKILDSKAFSEEQKRMFIPLFSDKVISGSSRLAFMICEMLNNRPMKLSVEQVLAIIRTCRDERTRVTYAAYTIDKNIDNVPLIKAILIALSGKLQKLAQNGNPRIAKNDWNELLVKVLQDGGYISSVSDKGESIIVYTRNNW